MHLVILERFKANPQLEYDKLIDWIGLDHFDLPEHKNKPINVANYEKYEKAPNERVTQLLKERCKSMKKDFYELIGEEIEEWEE